MRPGAPERVYLSRVNLSHLPSTVRLRFRLVIRQLYLIGKRYSARTAGYKTSPTLRRGTIDPPSSPVNLTMAQQNQENPTFTTLLSDPHFNLSAHTFAMHTLPFHNISFVLDLLSHNNAATQNLLTLDRINQTIVGLE